jgi:hypothetical protein
MAQEVKLATLEGVREYNEREPVELWVRAGRVILRAFNECHNNHTDVDLRDLLTWLQAGPELKDGRCEITALSAAGRNQQGG